jgi:lipopolysaccharide transport system permease protein
MQNFSASPAALFKSLWVNRRLITTLAQREVLGRYRGSMLGILWSFFNPVFMLVVYTFVFSVVFKARWPGGGESKTEFALILFAGLLVFGLFAECVNRAPALIISNVNYVKKVVFPLEILPVVSLLGAVFHMAISLVVWFIFYILFFGVPHSQSLLLPLVLLPFFLFTLGLSLLLASLGVFLRDVSQIVGVATTALMFLSAIFYPATALPDAIQPYLYLNPLIPFIESTRNLLVWGQWPQWSSWSIQLLASALLAWLGFVWFQKTRKGFADVL